MQVIEVTTPAHVKAFHKVPFIIYKNDKVWIPHLKQDVEKIFDQNQNKFFRHGECIRWILQDDNGKLIGRVAAFINRRKSNTYKQPTGGLGFFECIENQEAAFLLFDTCKAWLQERDMEAMDGPINFGENHEFWGMIVENFEDSTYYKQAYNPEYYVGFFKEYGFQVYFYQHLYRRGVWEPLQEQYVERAERLRKSGRYKAESIRKKNLEKYAEDFRTVYNRAWVTHDNFGSMDRRQAVAIMKAMKPVIDEDISWFVYHEEKPIAFFIQLPELNEIWRFVNGNLNWLGKLKFLYHKWRGTCRTSFGIAFGIDPEYQGKGIEGMIFKALEERIYPKKSYDTMIITWIGDFNPKMIRIIENLGCHLYRRMATMRVLFDPNATFERSPIIGGRAKSEGKVEPKG